MAKLQEDIYIDTLKDELSGCKNEISLLRKNLVETDQQESDLKKEHSKLQQKLETYKNVAHVP